MLKHMPPGAVPQTGPPSRLPPPPPIPSVAAAAGGTVSAAVGPAAAPRTTSLINNSGNSNSSSINHTIYSTHHPPQQQQQHNTTGSSLAANSSNSTATTANGSIIAPQAQPQVPLAAPPPPLPSTARPSAAAAAAAAAAAQLQPLNVSTISTSPHSILGGPGGDRAAPNKLLLLANGSGPPRSSHTHSSSHVGTAVGPPPPLPPTTHGHHHCSNAMLNTTPLTSVSSSLVAGHAGGSGMPMTVMHSCSCMAMSTKHRVGAREALTSLGLLCLVSLLLALLSLIFLLKISPGGREPPPPPPGPISSEDYIIVYDVTLALCALSLSLNLCCLLVCAIQFLFAVKLVRAPATSGRGNKYLQKSSVSRVCAVGGFFISIPIFLTGIILYTFTQFHSTPAIITSVLIGFGIVFCGCAMVHNVFVWQKEKTICVRHQNQNHMPLNLSLHAPAAPPPLSVGAIASPGPAGHYMNHNGAAGVGSLHAPLQPITLLHLQQQHQQQQHQQHQQQQQQQQHNNVGTGVNHTPLTHTTPVPVLTTTPLSPNHSHVSSFGGGGAHNNSAYVPTYGVRPATATPPTPKVMMGNGTAVGAGAGAGRDACGSVSPGMMAASSQNGTLLELSNVSGPGNSPHELSTLV